jgi:hypothetical protein
MERLSSRPRGRWHLSTLAVFVLAIDVSAAEQCGIPEVRRRDDFEATALPPPLIFAETAGLSIVLDTGQAGSIVAGPTTVVAGTFSGPPGTGISARGRPAVRAGNRWLIPNVPLDAGNNTITVTATTLAGATTTQMLNLTRDDSGAAQARLSVETPLRFAPGAVRFRLDLAPTLAGERLRLDVDDDGSVDLDTTSLNAPLVFQYPLPGIYRATATIDLVPGSSGTPPTTLTRSVRVVIQNIAETREDLCSVFGYMRTRLAANDVPGALLAMHPRLRPTFQTLWTGIGAGLPAVASQLGTIVNGSIGTEGYAEYVIARPIVGQPGQFVGFRVQFDRGPDGVWRIGSM